MREMYNIYKMVGVNSENIKSLIAVKNRARDFQKTKRQSHATKLYTFPDDIEKILLRIEEREQKIKEQKNKMHN